MGAAPPAVPTTMRAVAQRRYGGPEVLEVVDAPVPAPRRGEVLVRVAAAGVDRGAWHLMTGTPGLVRLGIGLRAPREPVRGRELAGVVVALGPGATRFAVGDQVFGAGRATFAEYSRAAESQLARVPSAVSLLQAAALPTSGATALQAVRLLGPELTGRRALVTGAGGGGSLALQLLRAAGAHVVGAASAARMPLVRELADVAIETGASAGGGDAAIAEAGPYDGILDIAGNRPTAVLRGLLAPGGTAVLVGGEGGRGPLGGFERQLAAQLTGRPTARTGGRRVVGLVSTETTEVLDELAAALADGRVRVRIHREYALDETAAALRDLQERRVAGKAVIRVGEELLGV